MTDSTDELVTSALDFGYRMLDTWFSAFRSLTIGAAELVNPDELVLGVNVTKVFAQPATASAVQLGPLTNNETGKVLPPHLVSISPAGVAVNEEKDATGAVIKTSPRKQELLVWVHDPTNVPAGLEGMFEGELRNAQGQAISKVKLAVSKTSIAPIY